MLVTSANMNSVGNFNKCLNLTLCMRDGTKKELRENVSDGSGDVIDLKRLCQSIQTIQTQCNNILTALVDQERGTTQQVPQENDDDDDEDDDDDDDDLNNSSEPPEKQQKR